MRNYLDPVVSVCLSYDLLSEDSAHPLSCTKQGRAARSKPVARQQGYVRFSSDYGCDRTYWFKFLPQLA